MMVKIPNARSKLRPSPIAGHGRFPLSLAAKLTDHNILGLDIRQKVNHGQQFCSVRR